MQLNSPTSRHPPDLPISLKTNFCSYMNFLLAFLLLVCFPWFGKWGLSIVAQAGNKVTILLQPLHPGTPDVAQHI